MSSTPQHTSIKPIRPLLNGGLTLFIQLCGVAGYLLTVQTLSTHSLFVPVLAQSVVIGALALLSRLPWSWRIINLLLGPAITLCIIYNLPAWPFGIVFILLLTLFSPTIRAEVPFFPSNREIIDLIATELPRDTPFTFVDLGCGFGHVLRALKRRFPQGEFVGIEVSPLALIVGRCINAVQRSSVVIRHEDIWRADLSQFDFVYAFLSPVPMPKLWEKASQEMKKGSLLIVNSFPCPTTPTAELVTEHGTLQRLFTYSV